MTDLSPAERAIVEEEEAMLERTRACLRRELDKRVPRPRGELHSLEALRKLQSDAVSASEDDVGPLLLEISIRQELLRRAGEEPIPDFAAPYFAHLRVRENNERKDYLLGPQSFLDSASNVRIVDWHAAPVAKIFYQYREGDEYEETFPGRVAEGEVEARRLLAFTQGRLVQIVGDNVFLQRMPNGVWVSLDATKLSLTSGGAGTAVRPGYLGLVGGPSRRPGFIDMTPLLDKVQTEAVAAPPERPLLVLGNAGSGKTTVALQRLAKIATQHPKTYPLSRMQVIVPEEGLARLSQRLLEPLGVGDAQVRTLDVWFHKLARRVFGRLPPVCMDPPGLVSSLKRHPAMYSALRQHFADLDPAEAKLAPLRKRLADLFTDHTFLERVVEDSKGTVPRSAIEETVRHTMQQLATTVKEELKSVTIESRKTAVDHRPIWEATPAELAGTIDMDDVPILLFVRAWRRNEIKGPTFSHVVLDEAEDFSLFELFVLGKLLGTPRSITLAGDEAQQTSSAFAGWTRSLETLGVGKAVTCRLALSYRCPRPVTEVAQKILGALGPQTPIYAAHEGPPVGFFEFAQEASAQLFAASAIRDLLARESRAAVAVVARNVDTARQFHKLLSDLPQARLVLRGEFSFDPGVDVTDIDSVKGLEFDYVVVPDASAKVYPATNDARRRLHVAATRASHQLMFVSGGPLSPILAEIAPQNS